MTKQNYLRNKLGILYDFLFFCSAGNLTPGKFKIFLREFFDFAEVF